MTSDKKITVAFLGALVPDMPEFQNIALRRSGNMVQQGIVEGLAKQDVEVDVFSLRPVASYPKDNKIFFGSKKIDYTSGVKLHILPFINILIVKSITGSIAQMFDVIRWSVRNRAKRQYLIVYNVYSPPIFVVWFLGKITGSKSVAILYDLGMPPKSLNFSLLKKAIYRCVEFNAKLFIPSIDGRIVINEAIAEDYGKGKSSLLIDGGISNEITERLFGLDTAPGKREHTTFLLAGSLAQINGTRLISEALKINSDPEIRVIFAGNGHDLDFVKALARDDKRVSFAGTLDLDALFELYSKVDVLLNLRVTTDDEKYLFPSKILECMTVGKAVLSTAIGHIEREYGNYCYILKDSSPEQLATMFSQIADTSSQDLASMGKRAREYMLATHTWDEQSTKILNYILKL